MKSGILLLDKSAGMTSFDCIRKIKHQWKRTDLGHGGTLDKFATGLLPILFGEGLKLARFFLEAYPNLPTYWKTYSGTIEFGSSTETGDAEGAVLKTLPVPELTESLLKAAFAQFVGKEYIQQPPIYSAKKVNGERASDLAREGKPPELKPVQVYIQKMDLVSIEGNCIHFTVTCSKGTYVRSLAEDLAIKLGTVGYVKALRRTGVGGFSVTNAIDLETVLSRTPDECIQDMALATSFIPPFELLKGERQLLEKGRVTELITRLANSGLDPNIYCGAEKNGERFLPAALLQLKPNHRAEFLRGINLN